MDWEQDDHELESLRRDVALATETLKMAVIDKCPGPHLTRQHRDRQEPWCNACGRSDRGIRCRPFQNLPLPEARQNDLREG